MHIIATVKAGGQRQAGTAKPKAVMTMYQKLADGQKGEAGVTTKTYKDGEHPQWAKRDAHVFGKAVKGVGGFWDGTIAFARFWDNYALTKVEAFQVSRYYSITLISILALPVVRRRSSTGCFHPHSHVPPSDSPLPSHPAFVAAFLVIR